MKKPEILAINTAAKSRLFEIQAVDLRFSNGELRTYERFKPSTRSAVMILAIDEQQNLLLTYEYAVGTEQYELGFPKGLMELGETPQQSANRELQEEIGFKAERLTLLRTLISSPGYILLAESLSPSKLEGDEPEPLQLVRYPLADIDQLIEDPNFNEARNLAALFLLKKYLAQR